MRYRRIIILFCFSAICNAAFPQLKAGFSATVVSGCTPLVGVLFQDETTGSPTSWEWNLGNGAISTKPNPSATYIDPGTYTITLKVKNANGADSITKTNYITVYAKPVVEFSATPTGGCLPLKVNFTDISTAGSGTLQSWIWDFGDGTSSTTENPAHNYLISDTFNVTLIATNSFGCKESILKSSYIAIADTVTANFRYNYTNICKAPSLVNFINTSVSESPLNYQWDFGDGAQSNSLNPPHTYTTEGTYNITLISSNTSGCADTVLKTISIGTQSVNFILPAFGCANEPIIIQDSSTPTPVTGTWDFGDGNTGTGLIVTHVYSLPGNYEVAYRANFNGCSDGLKKTIVISDKPIASFTSPSVVTSCSIPLTVAFTNTSVGGFAYKWDFGDGTTSTDTNVVHTYTGKGSFDVKLTAFNSTGQCADSFVKTNFVTITPPIIDSFINLPFSNCVPSTINFNASIATIEPVTSYVWSFGDGGTSTNPQPSYTYATPGVYTVKLLIKTISGCVDSLELPKAVIVNDRPVAGFTASPLDACASQQIQFTDSSSSGVDSWRWYFGDGGTSIEKNPLHKFTDTGFFTVTVYVSNAGCRDTLIVNNYIHINAPVASFENVLDCGNPLLRTFFDRSVAPESWRWDFGDGVTSAEQNPIHYFADTGVYNVNLIVTNGACADTSINTVYILQEKPDFSVTSEGTNFCKNDAVKFTSSNYNPEFITSFKWIFGDSEGTGFSPNLKTTTYAYKKAGTYFPSLITTDLNGCLDTAKNITSVNIYGPTAIFSNPSGSCHDISILFADSSITDGIHPITQWIWDYGDGITEVLNNAPFNHTYSNAGTYDVKLTVFDSLGCKDILLKPQDVIVTKPFAAFNILDSIRCKTSKVVFTNLSQGLPLAYNWSFGDGFASSALDPVHSYNMEGSFSVTLSVVDSFGCADTVFKPGAVTIANPVATFTISDSSSTCPPLPVVVVNNSKSYSSLLWDFGDGNTSTLDNPFHIYTTPGKYNLTVIIQGYGICADTATRIINLNGPNGVFNYTPKKGCFPELVKFSAATENTTKYIWDFGDGSKETTANGTTEFKYKSPGLFVPKLILEDAAGCQVPLEILDTIKISGVLTQFSAVTNTGCDSSLVVFKDSSIIASFDAEKSRIWNFGDGTTTTAVNPDHYYKSVGNYSVSLNVITDSGCRGEYILPVIVAINKAPELVGILPDSVCTNSPVNFNAQDTSGITDPVLWFWNFGNGDVSYAQKPSYVYTSPGNYSVAVIATASTNCADTIQKNILILPPPTVNAGTDTSFCRFKTVTLQPSGALSYVWATNTTLSCTNCANPVAKPDSTTNYYVSGTDVFGCAASDSIKLTVIQPVTVKLSVTNDTLCLGSSIQLNASGAQIYNWQPSTGLSSTTIANPIASPSATTLYTVIGLSDGKDCFADTAQVSILVAPIPYFNIEDTFVSINVGSSYQIKTTSSPDVVRWMWIPPAGLSCNNCAAPLITPKANINYNVQVSNVFGCTSTDNVRFEVLCNGANVFIPNTFSPNGDAKNEYFYPRGKGLFNIKSMRIFNRWGALVFVKSNFAPESETEGWDGKLNGVLQPSDVYVYVIDVLCENGTVLSYKGNVTLVR